jgi:hypothetical protein
MTYEADNWQLLQDLFHLAEITPESDRERVLAERCPDHTLCQRAMDILNASMTNVVEQQQPTATSLLKIIQSTLQD